MANIDKHGIDFADIGEGFFLSAIVRPAKDGRYAAIGYLDGAIVVIFALLGSEGISIVSGTTRQPSGKGLIGMSKAKYSKADLAAVCDNPEWTADDFAKAVPFDQAFPDLATTIRGRGAQKAPTKVSTTIRLSSEVIDHFRHTGSGWQARIDKALKEWIATH